MYYSEGRVPWGGATIKSPGAIRHLLGRRVPKEMEWHLPRAIALCVDPEVDDGAVGAFLEEAADYLHSELSRREIRRRRFVALGLLTEEDSKALLSPRHEQPWVLYYSRTGGLPKGNGVIPCSSMTNHGVGWRTNADGSHSVWLVTDRKEGQGWDLDSDIGHESAHAAFAPVPLFSQSPGLLLNDIKFSTASSPADLTSDQLTRACYLFSELAVVSVRGEVRPTESGTPLAESEELLALLRLMASAMPNLGFHNAYRACEGCGGVVDIEHGEETYYIGAAALRAQVRINNFVAEPKIALVGRRIFDNL